MIQSNTITPRETIILEFLTRVTHCQEHHLIKLINLTNDNSAATISRLINNLVKKDLITKTRLLAGQSSFIALSRNGAKLFSIPTPRAVNLATWEHDMLVVDLFLHLNSKTNVPLDRNFRKPNDSSELCEKVTTSYLRNTNQIIKTDSELKREHGIKAIGNKINVPDLLLDGHTAIEVELTLKTDARLSPIIASYMNNSDIQQVHYYVRNPTIFTRIAKLSFGSTKFSGYLFSDNITTAIDIAPNYSQQTNKLQHLLDAGITDWDSFWQAYK